MDGNSTGETVILLAGWVLLVAALSVGGCAGREKTRAEEDAPVADRAAPSSQAATADRAAPSSQAATAEARPEPDPPAVESAGRADESEGPTRPAGIGRGLFRDPGEITSRLRWRHGILAAVGTILALFFGRVFYRTVALRSSRARGAAIRKSSSRGRRVALFAGVAVTAAFCIVAWLYWDHIRFLYLFESLGGNERGYREFRHRKTGIVFVRLPGDAFAMGSPPSQPGHLAAEGPVHEVSLSSFLVAKHEVRQAEWKPVMGSNPSRFKGDGRPVENVSWGECREFCAQTGLRLPTEAEWEYACRAGTSAPYSGAGNLPETGWISGNSSRMTHPVGEKTPNDFGLYDMHGNVAEWCEDVYHKRFYSHPKASRQDPVCTAGSDLRVFRGGSWSDFPRYCRSSSRLAQSPSYRSSRIGFRPAFSCP